MGLVFQSPIEDSFFSDCSTNLPITGNGILSFNPFTRIRSSLISDECNHTEDGIPSSFSPLTGNQSFLTVR